MSRDARLAPVGGVEAMPQERRPTLEELKERKARTRQRAERTGELMTLSMGPQHPSMHGVYRAELDLDGEIIVAVRPEIGNLHRGVEKLCEHRTYHQIIPLTDRLDYLAGFAMNHGFCEAAEKLMGVEVPPRGRYIRTLAHELYWPKRERYYYAGVLSSTQKMDVPEDVDLFISISGPEPQRTELERIVLGQLDKLADLKRVVIALGKPEVTEVSHPAANVEVHGFLDRARQQEMMNRARMIVSRSGYTTVMEIAELGKKALFTPTPGQTEQVYLSAFYEKSGQFHSVSQYRLDLARDVAAARTYRGLEGRHSTPENVDRLFREVFAPYL